jgi:hypothetical protein
MNQYRNRGYQGNPEYHPYGMPQEEEEDFDMNDEWHEEEFDENVSHASSRAANTIVDSNRPTRLQNQLSKNSEKEREGVRASSPGIQRPSNYNFREASPDEGEGGQGAYEEGDYLVVGQEVIVEEQYDDHEHDHEHDLEHDPNHDPESMRDFRSAYDKLVEKMYMEQGNDLLLNREEYEKAMEKKELRKQLKERTDERMKKFNENKRRKMELIKQENEKKELENCTFKPQLITKNAGQRRNLEQFLHDQRKHEEEKALKRNILLEQESQVEAGQVHHPEINESSRKMLAKRKDADKPVHERLYGISKTNKQLNKIINDADSEIRVGSEANGQRFASGKSRPLDSENETFAPKINPRSKEIVRDQPVQELLYNDALRRKDMNELRKQKTSIKEKSKRSREVNENNIEYLIHRFNKEFEPTFEAVAQQSEEGVTDVLNYRQLGELLFDMGFLSGSASSESEERILLSSMWTGLGGAQNEGLSKEVIRAFLLAVEGVKITESVKAPTEEEFGQMKDGEFYPDCPKISKHFKLMYLNRIRHFRDGTKRKIMKVESEVSQDCTFQPSLSENTHSLAQRYRQKIAENYEGGKITVLDILTAQTNKQQWIEETKKELENKETEECTFHPMTNENVRIKANESMQTTGDKCFDLYQLASAKAKSKIDKSKDEYEFEKSAQECTFQPNIAKEGARRNEETPHYVNQRSIQETLERLKKGREEREFKKKMTERGYGEPTPTNKAAPKRQAPKRPTNYSKPAPKRDTKPTTQATVGSRTKKTEESKSYSDAQNSKNKRRSAAQRNTVVRETKSSQMKRAAKSTTQAKKEVRAIEHRKLEDQDMENITHPEQMYRQIEEEEDEIHEKAARDYEREDDIEDQEPLGQYIDSPQESPEYDQHDYDQHDYGHDGEGEQHEDDEPQEYEGQDDENGGLEDEGEGNPLLFVDVNLGPGRAERIVVYEGDTAEQLAEDFTKKHGLDDNLKEKLVKLLENQIAGLLARIDEELTSNGTEN